MNLPLRQAWKSGLFTIVVMFSVLLAVAFSLSPALAQTPTTPTTRQSGPTITSTPLKATAATTPTPLTATGAATGTTAVVPAALPTARNQTAATPSANPNLPANQLTAALPAGPSDVAPATDLTTGPLTPAAPTPQAAVNFSGQDKAPLGSWPVTIALVLIVLLVAWGAYQFLRKPAVLPADMESDTLVKVTPPVEPKAVAPLTNEAATTSVVDTTKPEAEAIATGTAAAAAAAAATAPATPESVTCSNCGTINPWDELHCTNCGAALDADKQQALAEGVTVAAAAPAVVSEAAAPSVTVAPLVAQPLDLPDEQLPYLETLSRADEQLEYVLDRTYITIGRARTNDIVIDNSFVGWETVSPYHAELRYQNGQFVLVDKQSDNGSFVNRVRTGSNVLEDGVSISFGKVEFIYRQPAQ